MSVRKIIGGLAALALLGLPASAAAAGRGTAHFTIQVTGVQTTKWSYLGPSYTDCNGTQTIHGDGTEVFRFDSGRPTKLLATRNVFGAVNLQLGSWGPDRARRSAGSAVGGAAHPARRDRAHVERRLVRSSRPERYRTV